MTYSRESSATADTSRSTRQAVVISLDHVEPAFYTGWRGELPAAAKDSEAMTALLHRAGFEVLHLENEGATREAVIAALSEQISHRKAGDHLVVYFSGHGATLPDLNHDEIGVLRDGAWCLWDGMFVDDELTEALTLFERGVRVVLISDSCYTGTIVRDAYLNDEAEDDPRTIDPRSKLAPVDIGERVYEAQRDFYDPKLTRAPAYPDDAKAAVLILSACERGELARINVVPNPDDHGDTLDRSLENAGSLFTGNIVKAWNEAEIAPTYAELFATVYDAVTKAVALQHPVMRPAGAATETALEEERAFGAAPQTPRWNRSVSAHGEGR